MRSNVKTDRRYFVTVILVCFFLSAFVLPMPAYSAGSIVGWGDNQYGKCTAPSPNIDFNAVSAGVYYSLGLKTDGSIVAWGSNSDGQCNVPSPNTDFKAIATGYGHALGLKNDGTVVAWGLNSNGECNVPLPNADFKTVAANSSQSIGLKNDGSIVAWGYNGDNLSKVPSPNTDFKAIAIGWSHALGLKNDGSVVAWGRNGSGQCNVPEPNTDFKAIAAGYGFSLGLKNDGSIVAWGDNEDGQCDVPSPNTDFKAIAAGYDFALGLKNDGSVVGWGYNTSGQCNVSPPNEDFAAISAGTYHSLGIKVSNFLYGGGLGTANDPYKIATKADLLALAANTEHYSKYFILTADIDLGGQVFTTAIIAPSNSPDGYYHGTIFTGVFDGNGHKITNFSINGGTTCYLALFGFVGYGGHVKNLGVEYTSITGTYAVAGLAATIETGSLTNCYAAGSVAGTDDVGGLAGYCYQSTFTNCHATGSVTGGSSAGGLVAENYSGTITSCYAACSVSGTQSTGGLVGVNVNTATLTDCYATGSVTGTGNYVGGLVGINNDTSTINNCYATGTVSGAQSTGGLAGYNGGPSTLISCHATGSVSGTEYVGGLVGQNPYGILTACHATGSVSGTDYVGGLMGYNPSGTLTSCYATGSASGNNVVGGLAGYNNYGTIDTCYAAGSAIGTGFSIGGLVGANESGNITGCYAAGSVSGTTPSVGGLVGWSNNSTPTACFWDTQTSGQMASAGGTGKTTAEMKTLSTFITAGWDFINETANGTEDIWVMPDNVISYPKLSWEKTVYPFGNIPGQKNTKLTVSDSYGVPVTFVLTGGGYGEVSGDANDQVTLYNTGEKSLLTISTPKGKTTNISSITANGSLKAIMAKTTILTGDIMVAGSLGKLTLDDAEDSTISIGSPTIPNPKATVTIAFDLANNLNIDSDTPIKSITTTKWFGGSITTPSLGAITTRGDKKRIISGDLEVDATIDGAIGSVKVAGELQGTWDCNTAKSIATMDLDHFSLTLKHKPNVKIPALGTLTVKGYFEESEILSAGNIGMIAAGVMENSSCFAGVTSTVDVAGGSADGVLDLPAAESAYFDGTASIKSVKISGFKGSKDASFINSNIAASNILSAFLAYPLTDISGVPFGMTAGYIKSMTIKKMDGTTIPLKDPKSTQTFENLEIRLY